MYEILIENVPMKIQVAGKNIEIVHKVLRRLIMREQFI